MRLATFTLTAILRPFLRPLRCPPCSPIAALAYDLPYDPYPWCAMYSAMAGGGTNCGFLTTRAMQGDSERCRRVLFTAISSTIRAELPRARQKRAQR